MLNLTYYNNGTQPIPATPMTLAPQYRVYDNLVNGYSFGYASSGDDGTSALANTLPYTTLFWHGDVNWVNQATVWDANTSNHNLPPSLYLTAKPTWFGGTPWPVIGPDVTGNVNKNPAQLCYEQGKMPGCFLATGLQNNVSHYLSVSVYPNPAGDIFTINSDVNMINCSARVVDVSGNLVKNIGPIGQFPLTVQRDGLSAGIYILELRSEKGTVRTKLILGQ